MIRLSRKASPDCSLCGRRLSLRPGCPSLLPAEDSGTGGPNQAVPLAAGPWMASPALGDSGRAGEPWGGGEEYGSRNRTDDAAGVAAEPEPAASPPDRW